MEIFFRRLPDDVSRREFLEFLLEGMKRHWIPFLNTTEGRLSGFQILQITDAERQTVEFHGLCDIEPASAAVAAIRRLNGRHFKGKAVEVHKVVRRSALRDRRHHQTPEQQSRFTEQRKQDRRRPFLITEVLHSGRPHEVAVPAAACL